MNGKDILPASSEATSLQREALGQPDATMAVMTKAVTQAAQLMQGMADMMRAMNDRITVMEKELRQMTPITGSQAEAIGKAIRDRALELAAHACLAVRPEAVREIGNLIRKDLRLASGIRSVKELPRVEYLVALERIGYWDDYKQMKALRGKYSQKGAE